MLPHGGVSSLSRSRRERQDVQEDVFRRDAQHGGHAGQSVFLDVSGDHALGFRRVRRQAQRLEVGAGDTVRPPILADPEGSQVEFDADGSRIVHGIRAGDSPELDRKAD